MGLGWEPLEGFWPLERSMTMEGDGKVYSHYPNGSMVRLRAKLAAVVIVVLLPEGYDGIPRV